MASIVHAIMVGKYNLLASEQSWDGANYNFQNMEGVRGVISFTEGEYICVIQNNEEYDESEIEDIPLFAAIDIDYSNKELPRVAKTFNMANIISFGYTK